MSLPLIRIKHSLDPVPHKIAAAQEPDKSIKVMIPYDGSDSAEAALGDLERAGLSRDLEAVVAVTDVWLPLSPYEITRAVNSRRMRVLNAGATSFAAALKSYEEQRVLSLEAERRIRSMFPAATVSTETVQDTAAVAHEILRKAKQCGAELIIVGSKGGPSPQITDYAGPAIDIARKAECSVRIARTTNRKNDSPVRMIIGLDGSVSDDHVVNAVAQRSWHDGDKANIFAVRKHGPSGGTDNNDDTNVVLQRIADELRAKGLAVDTAIRSGKPEEILLREARELAADCIFIESRTFSGASHEGRKTGLSRVAEAVALGAQCSVEIVRMKNFADGYMKPAA